MALIPTEKFYARQREWRRLFKDPYHQLEFITTMHFLEKRLPKKGLVLDAGGGPGRYTIELTRAGYDVVLLDLVPKHIRTAKRQIAKAGLKHRVKAAVVGDVTDLSQFKDGSFDAVLCLGGVLSHIMSPAKRKKAVAELVRVAKQRAPVAISVVGRLSVLTLIFHEKRFWHESKWARHYLETGDNMEGPRFHFFLPEELRALMTRAGLRVLDEVALQGLASYHEREFNRFARNPIYHKTMLDIHLRTANHPALLGMGEHMLFIGRKQR